MEYGFKKARDRGVGAVNEDGGRDINVMASTMIVTRAARNQSRSRRTRCGREQRTIYCLVANGHQPITLKVTQK
jgi:hypothetical protein